MKKDKMKTVKLVAIVVLVVLAVIIFWQNKDPVDTQILLVQVRMSRALLLILTFGLGFVTGVLVAGNFLRKKHAKA